jgi:hypothetical protein
MIVVDCNVIADGWINGDRTALAHRLRGLDPDWHTPLPWRSEMRNILAAAEASLAGCEHHVPSDRVLAVAERSRLPAYPDRSLNLERSVAFQ